MGFFLYLRAMRRWFTVAGFVLVMVGLFGDLRPILLIGFALIALQLVITVWIGIKDARTTSPAQNESTRHRGPDSLD